MTEVEQNTNANLSSTAVQPSLPGIGPSHEQKLSLPRLDVRRRCRCGHILHLVTEEREEAILQSEYVQVSSRIQEPLYVLATNERIVATRRPQVTNPAGATGVLFTGNGKKPRWLHHVKTDGFGAADAAAWRKVKDEIAATWQDAFRYRAEEQHPGSETLPGLRPPQLGALHAIGAHWSLYHQPATIVMPTGTGKTEVMIAALVAHRPGTVLVVVPSDALRGQTVGKFLTLGLLRRLGLVDESVRNPIVGVLKARPRDETDLEIFDQCHVVVATMSAVGQGSAADLGKALAARVDTLIVDEAHHIAADTWSQLREHFADKRVLQFTATPYRRDGKLVDGTVIYDYPLRAAQADGYFKPIRFDPVFEIDSDDGDEAIATKAVDQFRRDRAAGRSHLIMARCDNIDRAEQVHSRYARLAPDLHPLLVHSQSRGNPAAITALRSGESGVVVCVDMLGEGFDLPELKIAALHDTHKSLAILLQFTGRFTRSAGAAVGDATVIANVAEQNVTEALDRLYSEDADWNHLLSELSSASVRVHREFVAFLEQSRRLDPPAPADTVEVSRSLLRPNFSAVVYEVPGFHPRRFVQAFPRGTRVQRVWLHEQSNTLYFVVRREYPVGWSRSREILNRQWDLFVLHYDPQNGLLYLNSSDTSSTHETLAKAVGGGEVQAVAGDRVFRTLGNMNRLVLYQVGVRKHGRRNLQYAFFTGADVREGMTLAERVGSVKNNIFGAGYENGLPTTIGCSLKGRVWSHSQGSIPEYLKWCERIGGKLRDPGIDTAGILENALIPEEVTTLPSQTVLSIDWPIEVLRQSEERITVKWNDRDGSLALFGIEFVGSDPSANAIRFRVLAEDVEAEYLLVVGGPRGFEVRHVGGPTLSVRIGILERLLEQYLSDYPPLVRFVDMSELDGNFLVRPRNLRELTFPPERFQRWDWAGTDIVTESIWRGRERRSRSVQERVAQAYATDGYAVVFDDDGPGEAADLICLRHDDEVIRLALVHCKFSHGTASGGRVSDLTEVCDQAIRSAKWGYEFRSLCRHIAVREKRLAKDYRPTRFVTGGIQELNRFMKVARVKRVETSIVIAQPGFSMAKASDDQLLQLAAASSFLKETVNVDLDVVCSK